FVEITTNDAAYAEKTIRVYPVADLVIPIPNSINQQSVMQQASLFGFAGSFGFAGQAASFGGGLGALGIGGLGALGAGGLGALGVGGLGALGVGGLGALGGGLGALGALGGVGALGALGAAGALGALGAGGALGALGAGGALRAPGALGAVGGGGIGGGLGMAGMAGGGALGQYGNLGGQFGLQGGNQSPLLILLIRQVVGTPDDWRPINGANLGIGGVGGPGGIGMPGGPEEERPRDIHVANDLTFYPPANALVATAASPTHTKLEGGMVGARGPGDPAGGGVRLDGRDRDDIIVLKPGERGNRVAGAADGSDDTKVVKKSPEKPKDKADL